MKKEVYTATAARLCSTKRGLVGALVVSWHLPRAVVKGLKGDLLPEGAPPRWTHDGPWRLTARVPCRPSRGSEGPRKKATTRWEDSSSGLQTPVCTCRALWRSRICGPGIGDQCVVAKATLFPVRYAITPLNFLITCRDSLVGNG